MIELNSTKLRVTARFRRRALVAMLLLCSACAGTTIIDIDGNDSSVTSASLRVNYGLGKEQPAPVATNTDGVVAGQETELESGLEPELEPEPEPEWISTAANSLQFSYSRASGEDSQEIPGGKYLTLKGQTFTGPVEHALDLSVATLAARRRIESLRPSGERGSEFAFLYGLQFLESEVQVSSATDSAQDVQEFWCLMVGFELQIAIWENLSIGGRLVESIPFTDTHLGEMEVGLGLRLPYGVQVVAGYRSWRYNEERTGSDVSYELAGPTLAIIVGW